jgi:hypothetical protein
VDLPSPFRQIMTDVLLIFGLFLACWKKPRLRRPVDAVLRSPAAVITGNHGMTCTSTALLQSPAAAVFVTLFHILTCYWSSIVDL